jgi:putative ABC transport system ATP-binding protein
MKGTAPSMTIEQNLAIAYASVKHGLRPAITKKDREVFRASLAELNMGLEDRMKTKMGLLSGGQRQAITLLMAVIVTPKILLLDEHTAALDPLTAEKVLKITREVVEEKGITTLMITHNIASALELGNRTLMMDDGNIVLDLQGEERSSLTVEGLLLKYREVKGEMLDNDRILLS